MLSTFTTWLLIMAAILAVATIWTYVLAQKQRRQESIKDNGLNRVTQKHRIVANPILIAYVLFPIVIVVVVAILMFYYS